MSEWSVALKSSIVGKVLMAVTGIGLVLFVLVHMVGNLQMFGGQDAMNTYAVALRKLPLLLWIVRAGLIGIAVLHIIMSIRLWLQNRKARPVRYEVKKAVRATLASRTMIISGVIVLIFAVYHLLHFTFGVTNPEYSHLTDQQGRHDVYNMVVQGFQNVFVSGFYILAVVLLFSHLSHGASSFLQSLGWNHPKLNAFVDKFGPVVAWLVCLGFVSVPIGVLLGFIKPAGGGM